MSYQLTEMKNGNEWIIKSVSIVGLPVTHSKHSTIINNCKWLNNFRRDV